MVEFGHVLPEPGDEPAWTAALPQSDREMSRRSDPDIAEFERIKLEIRLISLRHQAAAEDAGRGG
jgi:hypothetical protein